MRRIDRKRPYEPIHQPLRLELMRDEICIRHRHETSVWAEMHVAVPLRIVIDNSE